MSEPGPCRSLAAERMRRHRKRRRKGLRCVTIELRETEIDTLVQRGLLKSDARNNTRAIREALYQYFDRTLVKWRDAKQPTSLANSGDP
jgi:hypothetical protein